MHKQLDTLLQREMTRKEFMATLGLGAATLFGFGSFVKFFNPAFGSTSAESKSRAYGSRGYGE